MKIRLDARELRGVVGGYKGVIKDINPIGFKLSAEVMAPVGLARRSSGIAASTGGRYVHVD